MERHLKELYDLTQDCPAVADAVMLAKIWIKQRGLEKVREKERGGRKRERERESERREGRHIHLPSYLSGIRRIHRISFLDVGFVAPSVKEDQSTDE